MKYLDYPILIQLSESLSANPLPELKVNVRFEAYSVKAIQKERKMFKEMEEHYMSEQESMDEMSFSPEMREAGLSSCFGRLDERESRKVHFLLVSTLNAAFPDHEFSALRPDHFMREITAGEALQDVTNRLLGPSGGTPFSLGNMTFPNNNTKLGTSAPNHFSSSPLSASPSGIAPQIGNPDLYRLLNEVVPLDECEVYSWMPEPEYDPHTQPEDGEVSDGEYGDESMEVDDEGEGDLPVSWGQAGMELDDVPKLQSRLSGKDRRRGSSGKGWAGSSPVVRPVAGSADRKGGLLWSANYFFYSKRQKRVLFVTLWCRKHTLSSLMTPPDDPSFFPLPISSTTTSTSPPTTSPRSPPARRSRPNPINRQLRPSNSKSDLHSTIPIRGMTPLPGLSTSPFNKMGNSRLATSAPSSFAVQNSNSMLAMAKMTKGGFTPKQVNGKKKSNEGARAKTDGQGQSKEAAGVTTV